MHRYFIIRIDHRSLKFLLEQKLTTTAQQVWLIKLQHYDYEIQYKRGMENQAPDPLSRISTITASTVTIKLLPTHYCFDSFKALWQSDPTLQKIIT